MFDIETNNWTRFEMGGVYDGKEFVYFPTLEGLVSHLLHYRFRGHVIYAHNGGRFDFLFILKEIHRRKGVLAKFVTQGARITEIKIKMTEKDNAVLRDSFPLLPNSLKDLCEVFAPEYTKLAGAIDFEKEKVDKNNTKHVEYLKHDCMSLYEIILKQREMPFVSRVGQKITLPSTSMAAWRTTIKRPIKITSQYVQDFCRDAYSGGRCEIFKTEIRDGYLYDANSLYPFAMLKPMPLEHLGRSRNVEDFGFHRVTVQIPDETYIPILWKKTPKLFFPVGTMTGTYFSEEIKLALECGAKILRHHEGHRFSESTDLFHEFVNTCYSIRQENKGTPLDYTAKLLMNSLYGKFCQHESRWSFQKVDPRKPWTWPHSFKKWRNDATFQKFGFIEVEKTRRAPYMLSHLGAAITAYARIHMARTVYLPFQGSIHYTDTDSGALSEKAPTASRLGALKEEYAIKYGYFLLPKCYYIEKDDGKILKKIKGFNKSMLEDVKLKDFKEKTISKRKGHVLTLRESLIRNNEFISWGETIKSIRATYDKRCVLPSGDTRPWKINLAGEIK